MCINVIDKDVVDISVIIPTKNRKELLREAIDSVLKQNKVIVELIIIDDVSEDDTKKMIDDYRNRGFRIKYFRNKEPLFAHESRRVGYIHAEGKYVIFMDDDDYYLDYEFFYNAIKFLEENKNINCVIGSTISLEAGEYKKGIDLGGNGVIEATDYLNGFGTKFKKPSSTLSAIFRKQTLDEFHFDQCHMINDTCIFLYGILKGEIYLWNNPVAVYRIHNSNISKRKFKYEFVKQCLNEKKKIYQIAQKENLLIDDSAWYLTHLNQSIYYFINSSNYDFVLIFKIFNWIIHNAPGIRLIFFKEYFKNTMNFFVKRRCK